MVSVVLVVQQEALSPGEVVLPQLSKNRLPFHPIIYGSPMEIISEKWLMYGLPAIIRIMYDALVSTSHMLVKAARVPFLGNEQCL